jgi:hypothetical protein
MFMIVVTLFMIAFFRYDVHPKLVSLMAPQNRGTMADSSRFVEIHERNIS